MMSGNKKITDRITPEFAVNAMIWVNVLMFIVSLFFSGTKTRFTLNPLFLFSPSSDILQFLGAAGKLPIIEYNNWWSLITANWLHGGILHLFFNMMALKTVMPLIIREYGLSRSFILYTLTGVAGFFLSIVGNVYLTIGASSGICGLVGAALYFGRSKGGLWGEAVFRQTTGWVISLVIFGFLIPNINNWSHAGGLISGVILGWALSYEDQRSQTIIDHLSAVALILLTAILLSFNVIKGLVLIFP